MKHLRETQLYAPAGLDPRLKDLVLAERLGFSKPHTIRKLIQRHRSELESYGAVLDVIGPATGFLHGGENPGGRPGTTFYLNEAQCLVVCALSRTAVAAAVRREVIGVFLEYRRHMGLMPVTGVDPIVALRDLCELADVFRHDGRVFLLAPVSTSILDALCAFRADREDLEEEPDGESTGDEEPTGDENEPSLASRYCLDQTGWNSGSSYDLEDEHDGREPDAADLEPSLGRTEAIDQTRSAVRCRMPNLDELEHDPAESGIGDAEGAAEQAARTPGRAAIALAHESGEIVAASRRLAERLRRLGAAPAALRRLRSIS